MNIIYSFFIAFLWAIGIFINRKIIFYLNSPEIAFCMISIVVTIFCLIYLAFQRKDDIKISMSLIVILFISATLCIILPNVLFFRLLQNNPSYLVTALSYTTPILVLIISIIFFREKVNMRQIIGVFLVVLGVFLCLYKS